MKVNQLRFKIADFRAIKEADILLNGITVVAGENGCGKSTLSQFLYYIFYLSNNHDEIIKSDLRERLVRYASVLHAFRDLLYKKIGDKEILRFRISDLDEASWYKVIDDLYSSIEQNVLKNDEEAGNRLKYILLDILSPKNETEKNWAELITGFKDRIHEEFQLTDSYRLTPDSFLLIDELEQYLDGGKMPKQYEVAEYNSLIVNSGDLFIKSHSVQQVVYIDTPMAMGKGIADYFFWAKLDDFLYNKSSKHIFDKKINKIIVDEILKGDTYIEEKPGYSGFDEFFIYKREDGSEFNLLDCATGIKSFAILQMLLKNGHLNKYTLLIIDEPEAHLHPQWIIEYARLIVLLNKYVGVKFFIASHNPDMVSAIKYISEAEEVDDTLNYYLAESVPDTYQYNYRHLRTDIEPIFESFNIALDRINLYGSK